VGAFVPSSTEWSSLCVCLLRSAADLLPHIQAVTSKALMIRWWDRNTLLIHAVVEENCYELVRTVLNELKADINICGGDWSTALAGAISTGDEKMVQLLLCQRVDTNAKDGTYTPLLLAIEFRHENIARMLFEHGVHVNTRSVKIWLSSIRPKSTIAEPLSICFFSTELKTTHLLNHYLLEVVAKEKSLGRTYFCHAYTAPPVHFTTRP